MVITTDGMQTSADGLPTVCIRDTDSKTPPKFEVMEIVIEGTAPLMPSISVPIHKGCGVRRWV